MPPPSASSVTHTVPAGVSPRPQAAAKATGSVGPGPSGSAPRSDAAPARSARGRIAGRRAPRKATRERSSPANLTRLARSLASQLAGPPAGRSGSGSPTAQPGPAARLPSPGRFRTVPPTAPLPHTNPRQPLPFPSPPRPRPFCHSGVGGEGCPLGRSLASLSAALPASELQRPWSPRHEAWRLHCFRLRPERGPGGVEG